MHELSMVGEAFGSESHLPSERLLPLVYDELRRLAASRMADESAGHTLQPTALVHEAWLRLEGGGGSTWKNQAHFFGAAARAMRRILVDHARRKSAAKRQSDPPALLTAGEPPEQEDHILLIHESLARLEKEDPEAAEVVLLKYFSGLGNREIARLTGSSTRSVERCWTLVKARLYQMIREEASR